MWRDFLLELIDLALPPRSTDRLVREVTLEQLLLLAADEPLPYQDPRVTALVWELKYYANRRAALLGGSILAEHVIACAQEELGTPLLIPVPMHATRRRERGHNQTELLCKEILTQAGDFVEYAPSTLVRTRHTPMQRTLPKAERMRNVAHAMKASGIIAGRVCIVVDDVTTTGATLEEAKRALREAGARVVHAVALARS